MADLDKRLAAGQIQGARDYQEDDYGISEVSAPDDPGGEQVLLVLADGMGGHAGGAEASAIVVRTFIETYQVVGGPTPDRLRAALDAANEAVAAKVVAEPDLAGMGATLVGVSITDAGAQWVSVGDSPLWLCRGKLITRLNADHSMTPVLDNMVQTGHLTEEQAASDSRRNALRSAVTGEELDLVDLASRPTELDRGDVLLIASDGLETLSESVIARAVSRSLSRDAGVGEMVSDLLKRTEDERRPRQDNVTVIAYVADRVHGMGGVRASEEPTTRPARSESEIANQFMAGAGNGKRNTLLGISVATFALVVILGWVFQPELAALFGDDQREIVVVTEPDTDEVDEPEESGRDVDPRDDGGDENAETPDDPEQGADTNEDEATGPDDEAPEIDADDAQPVPLPRQRGDADDNIEIDQEEGDDPVDSSANREDDQWRALQAKRDELDAEFIGDGKDFIDEQDFEQAQLEYTALITDYKNFLDQFPRSARAAEARELMGQLGLLLHENQPVVVRRGN